MPAQPASEAPSPPAPDPGAPAVSLAVGGSFFSRYELRDGFEEHGLTHARLHREGDYVVSRARLSLKTTPVDVGGGIEVSAAFVPQAAYTFGESTGATPTVSDHPTLQLYEGYASVGAAGSFRLDVGRFAMNYGDALVIGDLGWNEAARSFNGARLRLTPGDEPYFIDGFVTLISEGRLVNQKPVSGDHYFFGVYAGLGPLVAEKFDLDLYALSFNTARSSRVLLTSTTTPPATVIGDQDAAMEVTLGSRVKGALTLLDYRAEAGYQLGSRSVAPTFARPEPADRHRSAYQVDAEVGVTPTKGFRIGVEGLIASGDDLESLDTDEGYSDLFPTGHKWLGFADVFPQRTNVMSGVLHLKLQAGEAWTALVDAHYFARPEPGSDGRDGGMGGEIDTTLLYAIGGGAALRGMYAVFLPNRTFWEPKSTSPDFAGDPIHFFELQFGADFK